MIGELDQSEIDSLLRSEVIGRIGCHADSQIYIVPVAYVYDGQSIYGHTDEGMKVRLMRADPHVCFEVEHVENIANWRSAIVWGTFEELRGEDADKALLLLRRKLEPLIEAQSDKDSHALEGYALYRMQSATRHGLLYRINIREKTGRFEKH
jgi:nitroimidazol reductase NimA-like FMN-containing flavoprotein (pyridoxamine 5'-phosphate oxidase superfamily)